MDNKYKPAEIEEKWQKKWEKTGVYDTPQFEIRNSKFEKKRKKYVLDMFPYPSGAGLHVGHMEGYVGTDVLSRYYRMKGFEVLHPMGWDAFGLPAENYAVKTGVHPDLSTHENIDNFRRQLKMLGLSYDWSKEIDTSSPDYYKWTQWLFIEFFKRGLAYKKRAPANWCPKDETVLANEQVVDGKCERCGTEVIQKELDQWFLKITAYADELIQDLDKIDWPESTKLQQVNWIGRKEGATVKFEIPFQGKRNLKFENKFVEVFTTRPETIFGATFIVLAPEHELVKEILIRHSGDSDRSREDSRIARIKEMLDVASMTKDSAGKTKEKNGLDTGLKAINPATGEEIPVWVSNYVLSEAGTGAIMGVPAHDERDFEFAKKFNLAIKVVVSATKKPAYADFLSEQLSDAMPAPSEHILSKNNNFVNRGMDPGGVEPPLPALTEPAPHRSGPIPESVYSGEGFLVNSGKYDLLEVKVAATKIIEDLKKKGLADFATTYHIRDWLISRQRYWGCPIPMMFCEKCAKEGKSYINTVIPANAGIQKAGSHSGKARFELDARLRGHDGEEMTGWYPVSESELPVNLPTDVDFLPHGESPIARSETFQRGAKCPKCGGEARREVDTMDTYVDSSWYFLAFTFANKLQNTSHSGEDSERSVEDDSRIANVLKQSDAGHGQHDEKEQARMTWNEFKDDLKTWLPVDIYVGGGHVVQHLLFARFFWKALSDLGHLPKELGDEPFGKLRAPGWILGPDSRKMSKRWGNIITPEEVVTKHGADTMRVYEMFMAPFEVDKPWNVNSVAGVERFLSRIYTVFKRDFGANKESNLDLIKALNRLTNKVALDIEGFKFNTAISGMMEFLNAWEKSAGLSREDLITFIKILAPFAPHLSEELYQNLLFRNSKFEIRNSKFISVHQQSWPVVDEKYLVEQQLKVAVSINGKVRALIDMRNENGEMRMTQKEIEDVTKKDPNVAKFLQGKVIKKVIYVPGKIVNFVV